MKKLFFSFFLCSLCFFSCKEKNEFTEQEAEIIKNEIKARVAKYIESVKALDFNSMSNFWSDSKDFVYAGDGRVLGGIKEWKARLQNFSETTRKLLYWNNSNIYIKALAANAASYTMDFEVGFINEQGDTVRNQGAWTYVFEKSKGDWKVIHTNGKH